MSLLLLDLDNTPDPVWSLADLAPTRVMGTCVEAIQPVAGLPAAG